MISITTPSKTSSSNISLFAPAPRKASPIQFDWSRRWTRHVVPHLQNPLVIVSLEIGMKYYDPSWELWMGPHSIGRGLTKGQKVYPGKLSWYQPWGCCHWIAFFSLAIGVLNYPGFTWMFLSGQCHTVPVGSRNEMTVVMDILNFRRLTAEKSIHYATMKPQNPRLGEAEAVKQWNELFAVFLENMVPRLRASISA